MNTSSARKHRITPGLRLVAVAIAAGAMLWAVAHFTRPAARDQRSSAGKVAAGTQEQPSRPAAGARDGALRELWPVGRERRYRFEQDTRTSAQGAPLVTIALRGTLAVTRLSPLLIRYHFEGRAEGLGQSGQDGREAQFARELQLPFFTETSAEGDLSLKSAGESSAFTQQIWKSLVTTMRLDWPSNAGRSWEREEGGPLGSCTMRYTQIKPTQVAKERLRCAAPSGAQIVSFVRQSSKQQFAIRGQGIEQLSSVEAIETAASQGIPAFTADTSLSLHLLEERDRTADLDAWRAAASGLYAAAIELGAAPKGQPLSRGELLARVGGRTFGTTMAALLDVEGHARKGTLSSEDNAAFGRAFIALRSLLQLGDEHVADLEEHIVQDGPLTQHLLGVLGEAGTTAAQEALARLLRDPELSARTRSLAAMSLGRVAHPTPESVQALQAMQSDAVVGTQATYSLGSNAKRLAQADPALGEKVLAGIHRDLDRAPTDDKARYLTALGNAGQPESLDVLQSYARTDVPKHRRNAALGLRRIPGSQAEQLLLGLLRDPDATVRDQAVSSIVKREPTADLIAGLSDFVTAEPEFRPRLHAVQGLAGWLRVTATAAPALRTVAANDKHEDLRRIARLALEKYGL